MTAEPAPCDDRDTAWRWLTEEAGATAAVARQRAEDAILRIQGALVLARGSGNTAPFKRVLASLPGLVTKGQA